MVAQAVQWGLPIPDPIQNKPELAEGLGLFLDAFWALSSCRSIGMGLGPIPWTAVLEYSKILGLREEQQEDLEMHVGRLDSAFLKWSGEQRTGGEK